MGAVLPACHVNQACARCAFEEKAHLGPSNVKSSGNWWHPKTCSIRFWESTASKRETEKPSAWSAMIAHGVLWCCLAAIASCARLACGPFVKRSAPCAEPGLHKGISKHQQVRAYYKMRRRTGSAQHTFATKHATVQKS